MDDNDCLSLDALIRQLEAQAEAEADYHADLVQAMMDRYERRAA